MNCNRCGSQIKSELLSRSCPCCGAIIIPDTKSTSINSKPPEVNFEPQSNTNLSQDLLASLTESFFDTNTFFKKILTEKSIKPALLYGIVTGSFGLFASYLWSLTPFSFSDINSTEPFNLIFTPLFIPIGFFFTAFYTRIILRIFHKSGASFKTIFRIAAYSHGSMVLHAIPFLGPILSSIMCIYMFCTGLHFATSTRKLKLFVLLSVPLILFSFIIAAIMVAFLTGNLLSSNQLSNFLNLIQR